MLLSGQRSHLEDSFIFISCPLPLAPCPPPIYWFLFITPNGHAIMHIQHPTHFGSFTITLPSGFLCIALVKHASMQGASVQWRHINDNDNPGNTSSTSVLDKGVGCSFL